MSGESSTRSDLIDVTYQELHGFLTAVQEGSVRPVQVQEYLKPRIKQLGNVKDTFGKPNATSKKLVENDLVTLPDGVAIRVESGDRDVILAVSSKLDIDELQALILLRSFLYNKGLPPGNGSTSDLTEEIIEAIQPFYLSERLHTFRVLIPLFRAREDTEDRFHKMAQIILPQIIPDGPKFAESVIAEYVQKTKLNLPEQYDQDPRSATAWAKQNLKEQLVLLEVLFWTMWGFVPCTGPLVLQILEASYSTQLGYLQNSATLLLDQESRQLLEDCAAMWMLINIEILELETVGDPNTLKLTEEPQSDAYYNSPDSLKRLHDLITSHTDSQYSATYLAWAYVLSRLSAAAAQTSEIPPSFQSLLDHINPPVGRSYSKDRELVHTLMAKAALSVDGGLLSLLLNLLTNSPLFVTSVAWKTGSSVTDPNAIAFRSVVKGLVISLLELVQADYVPDFDTLVDVWIALFGRSETRAVAGICTQFWQVDWPTSTARRSVLEVARTRFPILVQPLLRLLRAMTGMGFLDTDPLHTPDVYRGLSEQRLICERYVFYYFAQVPSYATVIPASSTVGGQALYERQTERYGLSNATPGVIYLNLRPIRLPGGSTLAPKSPGRLLSGDGGENIAVAWTHTHSGWKLLLEFLTDYVNRRRLDHGSVTNYSAIASGRQPSTQVKTLRVEDIGAELEPHGDEEAITAVFDLVQSVISDNPAQATTLINSLDTGDPVVCHIMLESHPPDFVQLTTMILEEALSRAKGRSSQGSPTKLITSAINVLAALLVIPTYCNRVWLYIRSTATLFGSDKTPGFASAALAAERATGTYTMTLALLNLVRQLFREAASSYIPENIKLQQVKEEVLLRAARFVHTEVWVEHMSWKYVHLGDRFEIGTRVTLLYVDILETCPPTLQDRPFPLLSQTIADVLLFKATTSAINPLVSSIASGKQVSRMLYNSRRHGDVRRLIYLLQVHLRLCNLVLTYKMNSSMATKPCLLEQTLCSRVAGGPPSREATQVKTDPIDVIAGYIRDKELGGVVPIQSTKLLSQLLLSLSTSQSTPPTIVGHLSNPEGTVTSLVRIIQQPYEELALRKGIWNLISLAVDKEPALATILVTGKSRAPLEFKDAAPRPESNDKEKEKEKEADKGKGKEKDDLESGLSRPSSALDIAREILSSWNDIWEANPLILSYVFRFLDIVWQHALEHKSVVEPLRQDAEFWEKIAEVAKTEVGPVPSYETSEMVVVEGALRSVDNDAVQIHACRAMVKAHAANIIVRDIGLHLQSHGSEVPLKKPLSYQKLEPFLKSGMEQFGDFLGEVVASSYAPELYDRITALLDQNFDGLTMEQLKLQEQVSQRDLGDHFAFSIPLLRTRLLAYSAPPDSMVNPSEEVEKLLLSINLNLSLVHAESTLLDSWIALLRQAIPYLRADSKVRPSLLEMADVFSQSIAIEQRQGDMMASIHGSRLSLVLVLLEVAWFSSSDSDKEITHFMEILKNLRGIIQNDYQSPARSILSTLPTPFHRVLLQIIFFCCKQGRSLLNRKKALNSEQRLNFAQTVEVILGFVIDSLSVVFVAARSRLDLDLDRDMELLVAVFEQCTHPDIDTSSVFWLSRCQETDIIRTSLDLFVHIDLVGLSELPLLLSRKEPLYSPHLFQFHMALASNLAGAERFASEGVIAAYSNNFISSAISSGMIDFVLPELPAQRSPAHLAYCSMLAIVATVISSLGRQNHYFDADACGFVQLYGEQIFRALSWTVGDAITLPLLEEMDQVINLFYAIASSVPASAKPNPVVEKVLRVFSTRALHLLQQVNYAITHPNHLSSLYEPITIDERVKFEKSQSQPDPTKRDIVILLLHRLFQISTNLVGTLVAISRADTVISRSVEEWSVGEALVVPHSKVVLGEPASLGTLLELGNRSLDILRTLVQRPAGQSIVDIGSVSLSTSQRASLEVKQAVIISRRNLEEILLYAVTQLAMWLSKPDFDSGPAGEQEPEDQLMDTTTKLDTGKDSTRRAARSAMSSMAERLRRGMTGEMAGDLQSLLNKSKAMFASSNAIVGKSSVDISQILLNFLHDRVLGVSS
ncbi:hypothetical protein CPC08DRAFT_673179 [Agrocybe pediades]|nr:hypothetical protein CPC08DRAFT_673179 [Agrocybe pediades]